MRDRKRLEETCLKGNLMADYSEHDHAHAEGAKAAHRAAWEKILGIACEELNLDGPLAAALAARNKQHQEWRLERTLAVSALRNICEVHGDNDWPDDLHLYDVISKHLTRHLSQPKET